MQKDIVALAGLPPAENRLDAAKMPDAIRARTGIEPIQSGSVASEEKTFTSTDSLFVLTVRVVKQ